MGRIYKKIRKCKDCSTMINTSGSGGYKKKRCPVCQEKYKRERLKKIREEYRKNGGTPCEKRHLGGKKGYIKEIFQRCYNKKPEHYWVYGKINFYRKSEHEFIFSIDELEDLAKKTKFCRYCGCKLDYHLGQGHRKHGPSLDRINNKKNKLKLFDVQIICRQCNISKQDRTNDEFVAWCKTVVERN